MTRAMPSTAQFNEYIRTKSSEDLRVIYAFFAHALLRHNYAGLLGDIAEELKQRGAEDFHEVMVPR